MLGQIRVLQPVKIYPYIKEGQFVSADNEEIVIGFPRIYNFHRSRLEDVAIKEEVERIIERVIGLKVSVAFVTIVGNGTDGEIIRDQLVPPLNASLNPITEKTATTSDSIKSSNYSSGDDEFSSDRDSEKRLREKVLQDERLRKILEVFEGKLVRVKKSQ